MSSRSEAYQAYLSSPRWRRKRIGALARDRACQRCHGTLQLDVHHLTYERLGNESLEDLVVLCRVCHLAVHGVELPEEDPRGDLVRLLHGFLRSGRTEDRYSAPTAGWIKPIRREQARLGLSDEDLGHMLVEAAERLGFGRASQSTL